MSTRPAKPDVDPDVATTSRAVAVLRSRFGLKQHEAAAAAGMSTQYWNMHETGKVPGIVKPATQRKLIDGLNAAVKARGEADPGLTLGDLDAILHGDGPPGGDANGRLARMARELGGGRGERSQADLDTRQAVFPTRDGDVVIQFPASMSPAGFKDLEAYFAVFRATQDDD